MFRARDKTLELGRCTRIMGVVNLTPDSFSDGGLFQEPSRAVERCLELVEEGADILDLGGESSRPGAEPVSPLEELKRVLPVLKQIRATLSVPISVDTYKSEVAEEVLKEGADIINDISAFRLDARMPEMVEKWQAGVILMHMRSDPRLMQRIPPSPDILREIREDLAAAVSKAAGHGILSERIVIDPGIGFGKTLQQNYQIINGLSFLEGFHLPVMVGTSRKTFLGGGPGLSPRERIWGTAASVAASILKGAHIVRVHDVEQMCQVARVADAVVEEGCLTDE